tara:strand:- start:981 stop:1394 length:414 start_codon:yes stop_codon:yes gene_type:complete
MKKNDIVEYIGCSQEQINWGNNDDPRSFLIIGKEYTIEKVDVHSQHTKIKLYNKMGWFNSVCFEVKSSELNSPLEYIKNMDPSDIVLESTSRLFEYEKLSREVENCDNIDELKKMCRCFIKLHLKHQEVSAQMLKMK